MLSCSKWVVRAQVLVHGEQNEMSRLKAALQREHRGKIVIHTPRNTQQLSLTFRGDKTAKVSLR